MQDILRNENAASHLTKTCLQVINNNIIFENKMRMQSVS